jgi:hypothetical protein
MSDEVATLPAVNEQTKKRSRDWEVMADRREDHNDQRPLKLSLLPPV